MRTFMSLALSVARALAIAFATTALVFVLMFGVSDPAVLHLGPQARESQLQDFRRVHGLDRPLAEQFAHRMTHLAVLDLGDSFRYRRPVSDIFLERLPRTLKLGFAAATLELIFAFSFGYLLAFQRKGAGLYSGTAFFVASLPSFLLGLIALEFFAFRMHLFPLGGLGSNANGDFRHLMLPALILALPSGAELALLFSLELKREEESPLVRASQARGLPRWLAFLKHGAVRAAAPVLVLFFFRLPFLIAGALVVETLFGWPGLGRLTVDALLFADAPIVLPVVAFSALLVQLGMAVGGYIKGRFARSESAGSTSATFDA